MKKITLIGPPLVVKNLSELFKNEFYEFRPISHDDWYHMKLMQKVRYLHNSDLIHFLWGQRKFIIFFWAKIIGTKIINHYIGTDVLRLLKQKPSKKFKAYLSNRLADAVLCVNTSLHKELQMLDIQSEILPIVFKNFPDEIPPLPNKLGAYTYIPEGRSEFYGWTMIEQLIQDYPEMHFYVLANNGNEMNKYQNVEFLGWQDNIDKWIKKSYIYLRLTRHDGLPKMILEALAHGRWVIFSGEFPYCYQSKNYSELRSCFDKLLREPKLNIEGAKFVREVYHPTKIKGMFSELYKKVLK